MLTVDPARLALEPGARVLDLGCGRGRHVHALAFGVPALAIGADLSFSDAAAARGGLTLIHPPTDDDRRAQAWLVADAARLPFPDGAFDALICSEVLEHVADEAHVIGEIARVLRARGRLGISVPREGPERVCWALAPAYPRAPGGHVRIFKTAHLRQAVERAGFRHLATHYAHGLHTPYWWLQCLIWERRETSRLVRLYHRFLVWDMMKRPRLTRWLAAILDPLMGKSVVLYFERRADG